MNAQELKAFLDRKYDEYNTLDFIKDDPISIPHQFSQKEDIEISGFLTALIAWGRRMMIMRNAERLMELMDRAPYQFVMQAGESEIEGLSDFVHRTFNGTDCIHLIYALRRIYQHHDGLEGIFSLDPKADAFTRINAARELLVAGPDFPARSHKHLANPAKGSSAKRINMYLRWMVRQDNRGVDFGLWKKIDRAQLCLPLDVHTGNVARKLGILQRKQNDWKAVEQVMPFLRSYCPEDPVKYDFSLFGLGVYENF